MSTPELSSSPSSVRTWIFQANPKYYDIDAALARLPEMSWAVNQYKQSISSGDSVFLWRSGDEAGIVAGATVLTTPSLGKQEGLEFALQADKFDKPGLRVRLRINDVYAVPLSRSLLMERLPDLSILQSPQGTNFPVRPEEAVVIREMLANLEADEDEVPVHTEREGRSRVWVYSPGSKAQYWEEFYREGIIAIAWDELGDLSRYPDRDSVAKELTVTYDLKKVPRNDSRACVDFVKAIRLGDRVIAKRGRDEILGYGVVTGEYEFRPERSGGSAEGTGNRNQYSR